MNNCSPCYVKHGPKCPPECANSQPEPLFKDVCKLYRHLLYKDKRDSLEDDFCTAFKWGNTTTTSELYYQIKEASNGK